MQECKAQRTTTTALITDQLAIHPACFNGIGLLLHSDITTETKIRLLQIDGLRFLLHQLLIESFNYFVVKCPASLSNP